MDSIKSQAGPKMAMIFMRRMTRFGGGAAEAFRRCLVYSPNWASDFTPP
jgi:hypothetical protein